MGLWVTLSNSEDLGYFKKILNKRLQGPLPSLNSMIQLILEFYEFVFGFDFGNKIYWGHIW